MKTSKPLETKLTESGINSRLNHKSFLEHAVKNNNTKSRRIVRNADKADLGVLALLGLQEYTLRSKISIYPEFVAFAFHLYGISRKLFLYIIFHELHNDTCCFIMDENMIHRFREFCSLFGEDTETDKTILQGVRSLIRKNTMIAIDHETYMLNPLIAGGSHENKRRKLINTYSQLLERKGLNTSIHFYPKYQQTL